MLPCCSIFSRASGIGCRSVNRATGDCTCDTTSSEFPINVMRTIVDVPSMAPPFTKLIGSHVSVCGAARPPLPAPRLMMYQLDDNVPGTLGCRSPNPNTQDCSCEPGASVVSTFQLMVDVFQGGLISSTIAVCAADAPPPAARALSIADEYKYTGWFQLDDDVAGGAGCRNHNPATKDCKCATSDTLLNAIRVIDPNPKALVKYSGSNIDFCGQPAPPPPPPPPTCAVSMRRHWAAYHVINDGYKYTHI